jgi:hypothetical protein
MPLPFLLPLLAAKACGTAAAKAAVTTAAAAKCGATAATTAKGAASHHSLHGASRVLNELTRDDERRKK